MSLMQSATPAGAGLANDSAAYIGGARSILAGKGYVDIWLDSSLEPITHYPPLLSIVLSVIGFFGIDPLRSVRILNIVVFGCNTALITLLGFQISQSKAIALWVGGIFLLNSALIRVSLFAMSEPLFFFFCSITLLCFFLAFRSIRSNYYYLSSGIAMGLAFLTRYSGLALAPALGIMLLLQPIKLAQKIKNISLTFVPPILLAAIWFLRNRLTSDTITNRSLEYHPITLDAIITGSYNLSRIFLPIDLIRQPIYKNGLWDLLLLGTLGVLLFYTARFVIINARSQATEPNKKVTTLFLALFSYIAAVLFSISFFDHSTRLIDRILAPAVLFFVLIVAYLLANFRTKTGKRLISVAMLITLAISLYGANEAMKEFSTEGQGYASWKWHDSTVLSKIRDLPADVAIYTNAPPAVYLVTGRASRVLPTRTDPVSDLVRPGYSRDMDEMMLNITEGKAVLALFNTNELDTSDEAESLKTMISQLVPLEKTGDAALYGVSLP